MKDPSFNTSKNELTYLLEDGIRSKVTLQTLKSEGKETPFLTLRALCFYLAGLLKIYKLLSLSFESSIAL